MTLRMPFRFIAIVFLCLAYHPAVAENPTDFSAWLNDLRAEAKNKGISEATISQALTTVSYKKRVVASDRSQAEFKETYQEYINKRVSAWRIQQGQKYIQNHNQVLQKVAEQYGVPARFIVAIMGVETNYGSFKLKHNLFDVLATLAYDPRRGSRFRKEIFASLEMLDKGFVTYEQLKSSWAGALGVPQFMPSTFLRFAVDFDGDGRKDIWSHGSDLYASIAHYLSHYGWQNSETWARKVIVPADRQQALEADTINHVDIAPMCARYSKHLQGWRKLADWDKQGVTRMNKTSLPKVDIAASLIITDPVSSYGFLVYRNFCALMRYNPSFKYALSVGSLADAIK